MRLLATCRLQMAFTNIGTLVFNLSQTNSTVYTFMPLITQNLSNLNASVKVTQDTLANWRNVTGDGNYSVINVTNYIYLNGTNLTIFNAQVASNISGINATVGTLSQVSSNISGLNTTIANLQTADGLLTANLTNLNASLQVTKTDVSNLQTGQSGLTVNLSNVNASLQIAFTNIGTLVFNLSQTNGSLYTFMPLITQNLSNLNASLKITQDTLANWRNVTADGNYSVINVTNYIYLNGTNLTIFNAQVASNISGINSTVAGLSQAASNISGLNTTIGNLQTADGVITANITNLNASLQIAFTNIGTLVFNLSQTNGSLYTFMPLITQNLSNLNASLKITQDTLANWRNVTADGNYSVINVTNYIYLNGTNLTIFNAQVASNISVV